MYAKLAVVQIKCSYTRQSGLETVGLGCDHTEFIFLILFFSPSEIKCHIFFQLWYAYLLFKCPVLCQKK